MPSALNPVKALMSSFRGLGLSAAQVRHFFPPWWNDEAAEDENAFLELQILLARRLNVSLPTLEASAPSPQFRDTSRRFKTVHPEGSTQLAVAAGVGHGVAQVLAATFEGPAPLPAMPAEELRTVLLRRASAITLDVLCAWMWEQGVPVVHITNWPKLLRRPDAMCVRIGERPVILVVRKEVAPSRLTYLVAHEIGHIMSGHLRVGSDEILVDDTLPVDDQGFAQDEDEKVADAYALELLGGNSLRAVVNGLLDTYTDEMKLALGALSAAKGARLDAGQVILSWARRHKDWRTAGLAMRYLMTTSAAPLVINDMAKRSINADELSGDGMEHLSQLTGIEFHEA